MSHQTIKSKLSRHLRITKKIIAHIFFNTQPYIQQAFKIQRRLRHRPFILSLFLSIYILLADKELKS